MLENTTLARPQAARTATSVLLSGRAVSQRVVFSLPHIARLERTGAFPARRILGPARIGWDQAEITAWMQQKYDARQPCAFTGGRTLRLTHADRFLSKREVSRRIVYSARHIDHLLRTGQFPQRIRLGAQRSGFLEREIELWIASRPRRNGEASP